MHVFTSTILNPVPLRDINKTRAHLIVSETTDNFQKKHKLLITFVL